MRTIVRMAFVVCLIASLGFVQTSKAIVTGRVQDTSGAPISGVQVTVMNLASGKEVRLISDHEGRYKSAGLDPGEYEVLFHAVGFARKVIKVRLASSQTATADALLDVRTREIQAITAAKEVSEVLTAGGPSHNYGIVRIFYATDRRRGTSSAPAEYFSGERGADDPLSYGVCGVSIPRDHRMGELEQRSILKFEFRNNPEKHVLLLNVQEEEPDIFFTELRGCVLGSSAKEAFVFIHGYNVSFEDAARRTAQLAYDLGFSGAPILYSWPSKGSAASYPADEATIEWTTPHLKRFLKDVAVRTGASTVHLIAHSMGNRALTRALEAMASELTPGQMLPFKQVVLAAPDIDADVFRQLARAIQKTCIKITLYASSRDVALAASRQFHSAPRAGGTNPGIVAVPGIDTIDASALETGFLGHSYFAENKSILSDIIRLFRTGKAPGERCGMLMNATHWVFSQEQTARCPPF
jgi:esterase/lipase superfamily enzyme